MSILGHRISADELRELLDKGMTGKISGFVSKNGRPFDARLKLDRNENGEVTGMSFDFDKTEAKK